MHGTTSEQERLNRLASLYGIQLEYTDVWGKRCEISAQTKQRLLETMGVLEDRASSAKAASRELEFDIWQRMLPPVWVARESETPLGVIAHVSDAASQGKLSWCLTPEGGESFQGVIEPHQLQIIERKMVDDVEYLRCEVPLPEQLPSGYHRFTLNAGDIAASMALIVAPATCYQSPALRNGGRTWGISVQLYALRSQRNWGMGDFTDLATLIGHAARLGADVLGLNPLHVLFPDNRSHRSPYSPSSRLFFNSLYLDV